MPAYVRHLSLAASARLYMGLRQILGKGRGNIRIFVVSFTFSHYAIYFLNEYLQEKYTYEMILLF